MNQRPTLKSFFWLVYPLAVLVFIVVSGNVLSGESSLGWEGLVSKKLKIETDSQRSERLTQKIKYLKGVKVSAAEEDMKVLTMAVPISKPVLQTVASMKWAAALSGATVENYRSVSIGEIKEASAAAVELEGNLVRQEITLSISSIDQLGQFLENLEKLLPLSKVVGVNYTNGAATVTVIPNWSPLVRAAAGIDKPISDFGAKLSVVKGKLQQYSLSPGL